MFNYTEQLIKNEECRKELAEQQHRWLMSQHRINLLCLGSQIIMRSNDNHLYQALNENVR